MNEKLSEKQRKSVRWRADVFTPKSKPSTQSKRRIYPNERQSSENDQRTVNNPNSGRHVQLNPGKSSGKISPGEVPLKAKQDFISRTKAKKLDNEQFCEVNKESLKQHSKTTPSSNEQRLKDLESPLLRRSPGDGSSYDDSSSDKQIPADSKNKLLFSIEIGKDDLLTLDSGLLVSPVNPHEAIPSSEEPQSQKQNSTDPSASKPSKGNSKELNEVRSRVRPGEINSVVHKGNQAGYKSIIDPSQDQNSSNPYSYNIHFYTGQSEDNRNRGTVYDKTGQFSPAVRTPDYKRYKETVISQEGQHPDKTPYLPRSQDAEQQKRHLNGKVVNTSSVQTDDKIGDREDREILPNSHRPLNHTGNLKLQGSANLEQETLQVKRAVKKPIPTPRNLPKLSDYIDGKVVEDSPSQSYPQPQGQSVSRHRKNSNIKTDKPVSVPEKVHAKDRLVSPGSDSPNTNSMENRRVLAPIDINHYSSGKHSPTSHLTGVNGSHQEDRYVSEGNSAFHTHRSTGQTDYRTKQDRSRPAGIQQQNIVHQRTDSNPRSQSDSNSRNPNSKTYENIQDSYNRSDRDNIRHKTQSYSKSPQDSTPRAHSESSKPYRETNPRNKGHSSVRSHQDCNSEQDSIFRYHTGISGAKPRQGINREPDRKLKSGGYFHEFDSPHDSSHRSNSTSGDSLLQEGIRARRNIYSDKQPSVSQSLDSESESELQGLNEESDLDDMNTNDIYLCYLMTDHGATIGPLRLDIDNVDIGLPTNIAGLRNRQTGSQSQNEFSSRSHSMLTLNLDTDINYPDDDNLYVTKRGKLSFVDLAGSEKVKDSQTGETLLESNSINKSLLVLGNCISSLGNPKRREGHIPYRDSKLTKLLADSLGGNGVTLMIACVSPSSNNTMETMNTLRYANRAKKIKSKPVVKMDPREKLILTLKREIKVLRNENHYLREQLEFPAKPKGQLQKENDEKLAEFLKEQKQKGGKPGNGAQTDGGLYEMLQEYMIENESLRAENSDLQSSKDRLRREQQLLYRENDKLSKRIDNLEKTVLGAGGAFPAAYRASPISLNQSGGINSYENSPRHSPSLQQQQRRNTRNSSFTNGSILSEGIQTESNTPNERRHSKQMKPPHRLPEPLPRNNHSTYDGGRGYSNAGQAGYGPLPEGYSKHHGQSTLTQPGYTAPPPQGYAQPPHGYAPPPQAKGPGSPRLNRKVSPHKGVAQRQNNVPTHVPEYTKETLEDKNEKLKRELVELEGEIKQHQHLRSKNNYYAGSSIR